MERYAIVRTKPGDKERIVKRGYEKKTLKRELEAYRQLAQHCHFRLVPITEKLDGQTLWD